MENRASYLLVGTFVIAAILATFAFVIWLARHDNASDDRYYDVFFSESVSGLGVGGEVRYRGIRIGKVIDIRIKDDDPSLVAVRVEVQSEPELRDGDVAELSLQGITGLAFINISGATAGAAPLAVDAEGVGVVPSRPSSIDQLMKGAPNLVESANNVADRLNEILGGENQARLNDILIDVQTLTSTLAANAPAVNRIVASVDEASASVADVTAMAGRLEGQFTAVADNLNASLERLNGVLGQLDGLTASAGEVVGSANATLATVAGTFQTAGEAVTDLSSRADTLMQRAGSTLDGAGSLMDRAGATLDEAGAAARSLDGFLSGEAGGASTLIDEARTSVAKLSVALEDVPAAVEDIRAAAQRVEALGEKANGVLDTNTDAIDQFLGDGLNEFYRFIAESRRLVAAMTRLSDRLEREGARFLIQGSASDGYVPQEGGRP